jgi:hypothetical protein
MKWLIENLGDFKIIFLILSHPLAVLSWNEWPRDRGKKMADAFTVCTFNISTGSRSYYQLCRYLQSQLKFTSSNAFSLFTWVAFDKKTKIGFFLRKNSLFVKNLGEYP